VGHCRERRGPVLALASAPRRPDGAASVGSAAYRTGVRACGGQYLGRSAYSPRLRRRESSKPVAKGIEVAGSAVGGDVD
jgi:hypothetical protein